MYNMLGLALGGLWLMMVMFAIIILAVTFWFMMLIDCATKPDKKINKHGGRVVWILIIIFLGLLGAAIYYFIVKRKTN